MLTLTTLLFMFFGADSRAHFAPISVQVLSDWEIQSYLMPTPNRLGAVIEYENQILIIGGVVTGEQPPLGGDPSPFVYNLDLAPNPMDREWEIFACIPEDLFPQPWFLTSHNAFYVDNNIYIACDDNTDTALPTNDIWIFDAAQKTFIPVENGKFPTQSEDCCAAVKGEEIYIVGGVDSNGNNLDLVQIFNTHTKQWRKGARLDVAMQDVECLNVADEFIYVFGGNVNDCTTDGVRKYSFQSDKWQLLDNTISTARRLSSAVQIPNTPYILLSGGETGTTPQTTEFINLVEVWNVDHDELDNDLSSQIPDLSLQRSQHAGIVITTENCPHRGRWDVFKFNVYAIGGKLSNTEATDTTEVLQLLVAKYNNL